MKVLIVGSGGREHAIAWKIAGNPKVTEVFCAPGNGGTALENKCTNIDITEKEELVRFAKERNIHITIVGPEAPLCEGIVDVFEANDLRILGPHKRSAALEGSKSFAKDFMKKYKVKTAQYEVFDDATEAIDYLQQCNYPIVIKADGLAAGKGVTICENKDIAQETIEKFMKDDIFKGAGLKIVVEQYLRGVEASIISITDGETILPFISCKDHKQILDGDKGENTGGMGVIAPNPYCDEAVLEEFKKNILEPTLEGLKQEGLQYKGFIFFGIMICNDGVYLLEYNVRMGDPETQANLSLMHSDFLSLIESALKKELKNFHIQWEKGSACTVIAASKGYPAKYSTGFDISNLGNLNSKVFISGAKLEKDKLITTGGRVLAVTAQGENLDIAREKAYKDLEEICFKNMYYRTDIGTLMN